MAKTIYVFGGQLTDKGSDGGYTTSGIDITYTKSNRTLKIGGWYDSCVGIESAVVPLGEFLRRLGITRKDVEKELSGR